MASKKLPGIVLGDREIKILIFLWKWKLVSNAALTSMRFFPNTGAARAYNRLQAMRKANLIEMRCDAKCQTFAWCLTAKGFRAIREFLPALHEEGFRSEHFEHDLLVSAVHLGEWLVAKPQHVKVFTEQELRRVAFSDYPSWVPQSSLHRPDGYFGFTGDDTMIPVALEIEINRKSTRAYANVSMIYQDLATIFRVLWLVPSVTVANRIHTRISEAALSRGNIHNFAVIPEFRKHGWQVTIVLGPEAGKTLLQFLSDIPRRKPVERPSPSTTPLLLNARRSYKKSTPYPESSTGSKMQLTMANSHA